MFKCPSCGGSMYYSITKKMLKCEHCGKTMRPETYKVNNDADVSILPGTAVDSSGGPSGTSSNGSSATLSEDSSGTLSDNSSGTAKITPGSMQVTIYTCHNCGAQLESPDDSLVSYCPYCGSEQILKSRETSTRPARILPFSISRKVCQNRYNKDLKHILYLPKDFRDASYISKFCGVYIPYWHTDVAISGSMPVEIKRTSYSKHRTYTTDSYYEGTAEATDTPCHVITDASAAFDNTIANHIAPFNTTKERNFTEGYLAGFYADMPSSDEEAGREETLRRTRGKLYDEISSNGFDYIDNGLSMAEIRSRFQLSVQKRELHLYPVWFLTWRHRNRVAYCVMNGQSGKMSADLPVDGKKYTLAVILTAAVLFLLFSLFFTVTAPTALFWTALITLVFMIVYDREMHQLRDFENHIFDMDARRAKTMDSSDAERLREQDGRKRKARNRNDARNKKILEYTVMIAFYVVLIILLISGHLRAGGMFLITAAACIYMIRALLMMPHIREKAELSVQILSFAALLVSLRILLSGAIEDELYYGACIGCLVCAILTSALFIRCYNLLATRPVPSFFTKEGGKNDAAD